MRLATGHMIVSADVANKKSRVQLAAFNNNVRLFMPDVT